MSKKPSKKPAKRAIVKPPYVPPRQPKLKRRKAPTPRANGADPEPPFAPSPLELGPRMLPTADLALEVLEEVAVMNDRALQLEADYKEKAEAAKNAKAAWKAKIEEVQRCIRLNSHPSELPLLSAAEQEADMERMEQAIEAGGEL